MKKRAAFSLTGVHAKKGGTAAVQCHLGMNKICFLICCRWAMVRPHLGVFGAEMPHAAVGKADVRHRLRTAGQHTVLNLQYGEEDVLQPLFIPLFDSSVLPALRVAGGATRVILCGRRLGPPGCEGQWIISKPHGRSVRCSGRRCSRRCSHRRSRGSTRYPGSTRRAKTTCSSRSSRRRRGPYRHGSRWRAGI